MARAEGEVPTNCPFDVVVVGAGPAGAAAAAVLARAGRRVLLVGPADRLTSPAGESLPPAARPLLRALGALDQVIKDGHLACLGNLSVWGSPDVRCVDFLFDPNGRGWILDRAAFDAALVEVARGAGAEVCSGYVRRVCREKSAQWCVSIDDQRFGESEIGCRWVIDASGRRAVVARRLGTKPRVLDRLTAFTVVVGPSERPDTELHTLVEAVPGGWWYTALVPGGRRVFIYLTDADLAPRGISRELSVFRSLLDQTACIGPYFRAFGYRLQHPPQAGSARTARLDRAAGDGWAAAGDAAMALDPLSSRGILTALWTGTRCGEAVDSSLGGDADGIRRYAEDLGIAFADYLREQAEYYSMERRWADRAFWKRRRRVNQT